MQRFHTASACNKEEGGDEVGLEQGLQQVQLIEWTLS